MERTGVQVEHLPSRMTWCHVTTLLRGRGGLLLATARRGGAPLHTPRNENNKIYS